VRGCIQRRIGQLAVRDEQDIGAAVHHLMREAISMHSEMPLGCHQRPRCWPMAKWCNQKQSEAIRSNQRSNHLLRYWSLKQKQSEKQSPPPLQESQSEAIRMQSPPPLQESQSEAIRKQSPPPLQESRAHRGHDGGDLPRQYRRRSCTHARSSGRLSAHKRDRAGD
jgi:hypothetical protein